MKLLLSHLVFPCGIIVGAAVTKTTGSFSYKDTTCY